MPHLRKLLNDEAEFDRISKDSSKAATDYVLGLSIFPMEQYLKDLSQRRPSVTISAQGQKNDLSKLLDGLPAEKLAALAAHLKKDAQQN